VARRQPKPRLEQAPLLRRFMDRGLKEASWQKEIEAALDFFGWWWSHNPPNVVVCPKCRWKIFRGIRKGIPDIWAIRPPFMLWIECKAETGQLDPQQRVVGDMIRACGLQWIHARPRDREHILNLIAHPETFAA